MKSPKALLVALLALATLGSATLAWKQYQELILLRAAALDGDDRAALKKLLAAAEKRANDYQDQLAALGGDDATDAPGEAATSATPAATNNRGQRGGRGGPGGAMATLMQKPEVQKLIAIEQKAQLDTRYAALFKSLNLSPEQLDKFKNLLLDRQASRQDVMTVAREQGLDPRNDREAISKLMASSQAELDASIKAAIGDNAFAQYKNFEQTGPQRNTVDRLQQSLSYTSAPLTGDQAAKMVQILSQTTPPRNAPGTATTGQPQDAAGNGGGRGGFGGGQGGGGGFGGGGGGGGGQASPITNQAVTLAQGVLTPVQLAALQQLQQAQQAQQQVNQLIRQAVGENNPGARTAPAAGTPTTPGATGGTAPAPRRNRAGGG